MVIMDVMTSLPSYDELPRRSGLPCVWELWQPDGDVFGRLNPLFAERAAAAARSVERGVTFPLNWSMGLTTSATTPVAAATVG